MSGPVLLATSCLQGQPIDRVSVALRSLGVDALQLTPGCHPSGGFRPQSGDRTHHGYDPERLVGRVWEGARLVATSHSVHPPARARVDERAFWAALESGDVTCAIEIMDHPDRLLGSEAEIRRAMSIGIRLAVDVSHVDLQLAWGSLSPQGWHALASYDRVDEVHVSQRRGRFDAHLPLREGTFGLAWARERRQGGVPVVLESYLHRLTRPQREAQVELVCR